MTDSKIISNKNLQRIVVCVIVVTFVVPQITQAISFNDLIAKAGSQEEDLRLKQKKRQDERNEDINSKKIEKQEDKEIKKDQKICDKIVQKTPKVVKNTQARIQEKYAKLEQKRNIYDQQIQEKRKEQDLERAKRHEELMNIAKTDEQIAAVKTFIETVDAAISDYRNVKDVAKLEFRKALEDLIMAKYEENQTKVDYEAIQNAYQKAKLACEGQNPDVEIIRSDYQAALNKIKENRQVRNKDREAMGQQVKVIVDARKLKIEAAREELKTTIEIAESQLKLVFNNETSINDKEN